jgi:hypothetical protein
MTWLWIQETLDALISSLSWIACDVSFKWVVVRYTYDADTCVASKPYFWEPLCSDGGKMKKVMFALENSTKEFYQDKNLELFFLKILYQDCVTIRNML